MASRFAFGGSTVVLGWCCWSGSRLLKPSACGPVGEVRHQPGGDAPLLAEGGRFLPAAGSQVGPAVAPQRGAGRVGQAPRQESLLQIAQEAPGQGAVGRGQTFADLLAAALEPGIVGAGGRVAVKALAHFLVCPPPRRPTSRIPGAPRRVSRPASHVLRPRTQTAAGARILASGTVGTYYEVLPRDETADNGFGNSLNPIY